MPFLASCKKGCRQRQLVRCENGVRVFIAETVGWCDDRPFAKVCDILHKNKYSVFASQPSSCKGWDVSGPYRPRRGRKRKKKKHTGARGKDEIAQEFVKDVTRFGMPRLNEAVAQHRKNVWCVAQGLTCCGVFV